MAQVCSFLSLGQILQIVLVTLALCAPVCLRAVVPNVVFVLEDRTEGVNVAELRRGPELLEALSESFEVLIFRINQVPAVRRITVGVMVEVGAKTLQKLVCIVAKGFTLRTPRPSFAGLYNAFGNIHQSSRANPVENNGDRLQAHVLFFVLETLLR